MWDVVVAALSLLTVLTLGPTLLVTNLERRGWQRMGRGGKLFYVGSESGWRAWRLTCRVADWVETHEVALRVSAFIAAGSAAGIQLVRSL